MAPEVMPVTCYNLDPLINLIYFYHLDSLVVVLLLTSAIHEVLLLQGLAHHLQGVSKRRQLLFYSNKV